MGKSGHSRRSVSLVEDECLVLTEVASEMERAGWAVIEASSGEGAINHLRNGERIDLLVTDIQLAGYLTGWDVAETARKTRPELPVVYTSGNVLNRARKVAGKRIPGRNPANRPRSQMSAINWSKERVHRTGKLSAGAVAN